MRIKLLLKFFLNGSATGYLRGLQQELGDSSNAIRVELNRLHQAGLLITSQQGNKKVFCANTTHPLYSDIHSIVRKYVGIDKIISNILENLGQLKETYLLGSFAKGLDSPVIDLLFVGAIDKAYLLQLVEKAELLLKRKIRFVVYDSKLELNLQEFSVQPLLIWEEHI